ncbi:MAG: type IV pilus assembly protein PilM [Acidobacteria bacterium]|nr:type IV pilus assembly protein PilM [Acidobacteriota bacterium]
MFFKTKQVVGLDIGSSAIKAVELKPGKQNKYELLSLGLEPLPPDTIVDGAIIAKLPVADAINKIYSSSHIKNSRVATSISGHSVIVKRIVLPSQSEGELMESIQWEAEQYIPFDIADVNLDYQILREIPGSNNIEVLLVAAKKDKITDHIGVITLAGKNPLVVDIDSFALQNSYEFNYAPEGNTTVALLNIGASVMNINIVKGRDFLFSRDISVGGNQFTDFLQKELNVEYETAERLKRSEKVDGVEEVEVRNIIHSVSEIIVLEIQKTLDFFKATASSEKIDRMLVSGGAAHIPSLVDFLAQKFDLPTETFDSFRNVTFDPRKYDPGYLRDIAPDMAIAAGLALRSLEDA